MLIHKMKYINNLTVQEQHIIDYILEHPGQLFDLTANELAKATFTSSSTIIRLCKKLGAKGFPDFQIKFALEYKDLHMEKYQMSSHNSLNDDKEIHKSIHSLPFIYEEAIYETQKMLDYERITKIIKWISNADRVNIYGVDANYYIAQQICARWNEFRTNALAFNSINKHYLVNINQKEKHISFVISHSGNNKAIIDIAQTIRLYNQKVIAVTGNEKSELISITDDYIKSYTSTEQFALSKIINNTSTQYIFDILYLNLLDNIHSVSKKKLMDEI
ncbi:MurR/RpiR family transcriptional regulator [Oceanobacillus sojae]|uniref:RpiR family transcriptional regulator n=1 Tax=Oceanobacillus sojae TaxID=582851 RepID=A0A511ZNI7_9BACI|nr:MurR/RpiR family transcriptional regulator [Oceanobacillus sojae]GEN89008.1 RpiR family transcriptional regulator [Oceanobacillus sojae]